MYGYHHNPLQTQHATGYDYGRGAFTGTNGLTVQGSSPAWPSPDTSGETMDKIKVWLDKAPIASYPSVKNKHLAIGGAVLAVGGLAWYGSKHRWF